MQLRLVEEGVEACRNNDFEKGVSYFDEALLKEPDHIEALYNRARALSRLGKLKKSLADFRRLTELQPENASFIGDYAVSLHLNEKNDEAAAQFELALKLDSNNPYRYSSRAFFKDRIGDLKGAIEDYEKAIALDPEDAIALNNKGLVEEKLGYTDKAQQSFKQSNDLVGYQPPQSDKVHEDVQTNKSPEEADVPLTRMSVVRSIFTKDGFRDFRKFSASFLSGKKDRK